MDHLPDPNHPLAHTSQTITSNTESWSQSRDTTNLGVSVPTRSFSVGDRTDYSRGWFGTVPPRERHAEHYYLPYPLPIYPITPRIFPWYERAITVIQSPDATPAIKALTEEVEELKAAVEKLTETSAKSAQDKARMEAALTILMAIDPNDTEALTRAVKAVQLLLGLA